MMTADFVLVVASPAYRETAQGAMNSSRGRGASFEAAVLRESFHRERTFHFRHILPVVLPGGSAEDVPLFLQPHTSAYYRVAEITTEGVKALLRTLTNQPCDRAATAGTGSCSPAADGLGGGGGRGRDTRGVGRAFAVAPGP